MHTAAKLAALTLTLAPAGAVLAQTADPSVEQQLNDQEQRIKVLERKLELANETATAAAASTPVVKSAASGFSLNSADGKNVIKLRGTLNADGRYYLDKGTTVPTSADTWLLRKVRPYIEGTVNGIYDFRLMPDFGAGRSVVLDAYVAARFKPWAVITAGKFKGPVGLERLQTEAYNRFVELGLPSALVPNRDLGVQFAGSALKGTLTYAVAYVDGVVDGGSVDGNTTIDADNDGKREWEGRVFAQPFLNSDNFYLRGLGFGVGGSYGQNAGSATSTTTGTDSATTTAVTTITTTNLVAGYRTPGQLSFFSYRGDTATSTTVNEAVYGSGTHSRISPQAYYYFGSVGVLGEYVQSKQAVARHVNATTDSAATLTNKAWQIATSYFLTGEDANYNSVTPAANFEIGKPGWGAVEVAARYQKLDIDDEAFTGGAASFANPVTAASAATSYGVAVNWYLNQNVRWTLEYDQTKFDGGAGTAANVTDRPDEKAILTRFSLVF